MRISMNTLSNYIIYIYQTQLSLEKISGKILRLSPWLGVYNRHNGSIEGRIYES